MPIVKKSRLGEAVRGTAASNGSDNIKAVFPVARKSRLKWLVIGGVASGAVQPAGGFSFRVIVSVSGAFSDNGANATSTGAADLTNAGEVICDQRVMSAASTPIAIPLGYTCEEGETVTVEVTAGVDNGSGAALATDAGLHICADDASADEMRI